MDDLRGTVILVTGATDGLGRQLALDLAGRGATVLAHGRRRERLDALLGELEAAGRAPARGYLADLASLEEVRRMAREVLDAEERLGVLVNNAGVGAGDERLESVDGHELRFAVNYLAGFLLTRLLLDRLRASAPSRVVNVASIGQAAIDFDDVMLERGSFSGFRAYAQSKLAQIMSTIDLAEELDGSGVDVNALHPATLMDTTMVRESFGTPRSSVREGADAALRLVAGPELEGVSGRYFEGTREGAADPQAYDPQARAALRRLSVRLTGLQT
ncbi:MAG TPA: SDR family NAD(P)-dependent oxidoreductase [Solirubrobacteraceae bacterium]|nr:SDR family NAD(P)-dependent oxidoreductase [Solirubrobacteraceae bacterium]